MYGTESSYGTLTNQISLACQSFSYGAYSRRQHYQRAHAEHWQPQSAWHVRVPHMERTQDNDIIKELMLFRDMDSPCGGDTASGS